MTNNAKQPSGITRFFNRPTYNRHKNVIWILILNIVTALCQFIIYRYIIKFLGIESMGVWSLVIAATAIGQISNFGFSNGLIKYIPELIISNDKKGIQQFTGTANIANIALSAPLLVALYVPTLWFADSILTPEQLHLFKQIIPWCMLSILLNNIASVFAFLFDGFQLFFVRSMIQSAGFVVFLIVGLILASIEGLPGIAQALCCQSLFVLISYSLVARNKNLTESYFPLLFNKPAFRQLFSFGMKFQLISLLNIFFDPLIKYFITKRFGLTTTGLFEVANKIVMMARNMLVSSNQVVTPKVAAHQVTGTVKPYLSAYFERNLLFSVGVTIAVLVVAPLIGYYFIGHFDPVLQAAIVIVSAGWLLNMIVAPLYYAAIGMGKLSIIIMVHFIQSLTIVAALAIPLNLLNPYLPYIVPSASLGIAAFFILAMFNNVLALPDKKTGYTSMLFVLLVSILFFYSAVNLSFAKNLLVAGAVGLTAIAGLLFNPTIRSYFSGIMSKNNTGS